MTSAELEAAAAAEYAKLPDAQHRRLMRLHLTGDLGPGAGRTVGVLVAGGMVEPATLGLGDRSYIVLTRKGRAYCGYHGVREHAA